MKKKLTKSQRLTLLMAQKGQVFRREPNNMRKPSYWVGSRGDVVERLMSAGLLKFSDRPADISVWSGVHAAAVTPKGEQALREGEYDV